MPHDLITDTRGALLTPKEKVQLVWPLFIPPAGTVAMTITCIILANRIGTRRAAAMAAAFTVSEKAFGEYRDKVVEKMGANKERLARDEIVQDHIRENPVSANHVHQTGGGNVLCYDDYTGRYFYSSMESIKKACNDTNYQIINHGSASLNDYYNRVGLPNAGLGEEIGWNADALLEPTFPTHISDDDRPVLGVTFRVAPVRGYDRVHY